MSGELPARVLHVLNGAGGGAALSTCGLARAMAAHGIVSSAVCHSAGTSSERDAIRQAFEGRVLFTPLYFWHRRSRAKLWKRPLIEARQLLLTSGTWGSRRRVAEFAEQQQAQLIHTNTILNPEGAWVAIERGLPHVWHLRELLGPGNPFRLPREGPALGRYLQSRCSFLVANSRTTAKAIVGWIPEEHLRLVENGIDLSPFEAREPAENPPIGRKLVVGMVANLTSRVKRHDLFIEAAALLDPELPLVLRLYGHTPAGDPYVEELRQRATTLGLGERLQFAGFVPEPPKIMAELDILVHPTGVESFGRIVVEAMAAGLPVVGVDQGGVGEIVDHQVTGLLAPPNDPAALADAIDRLARHQALRQTLGRNGRAKAEQSYSLDACAEKVIEVYRQAMSRPLGRGATSVSGGQA